MIIQVIATKHPQNHPLIAQQVGAWKDVDQVHVGETCVIIITAYRKGLSAAVTLHRLRGYLNLEVYQL